MVTSSPSRFLTFRLRTLLFAITLIATLLGFWVSWLAPSRRQGQAVDMIEGLGGHVTYGGSSIGVQLPTEYLTDYFRPVTAVDLHDAAVNVDVLRELHSLPHLASLSLEHSNINDDMLVVLRGCENLKELNLADNPLHSQALVHLKHLPNLRWLNLRRTEALTHSREVDPADPQYAWMNVKENQTIWASQPLAVAIFDLREMRSLEILDLSETEINDNDLQELACLTNLKELQLRDTTVSDYGVRELSALSHLETLDLTGTPASGQGLGSIQSLRRLNLHRCHEVSDAGLTDIGRLKNLEELDLGETGYRYPNGETMSWSLSLTGTKAERAFYRVLGYPDPRPLVITDAGLKELHALQHLQAINLQGTDVTVEGKRELHRALPNLVIVSD